MRTLLLTAALVALGTATFAETGSVTEMRDAVTPTSEAELVEWTLIITSDIYKGIQIELFPSMLTQSSCLGLAISAPAAIEASVEEGSDVGAVCINHRTGEVAIPE